MKEVPITVPMSIESFCGSKRYLRKCLVNGDNSCIRNNINSRDVDNFVPSQTKPRRKYNNNMDENALNSRSQNVNGGSGGGGGGFGGNQFFISSGGGGGGGSFAMSLQQNNKTTTVMHDTNNKNNTNNSNSANNLNPNNSSDNNDGSSIVNKEQSPQYTMPGVLHFLQHEWARFELERSQWELDRAEFQARIAFLQGERKGQENLKTDLVRRIKMLEYALKQERAKYHKLKYGTDLVIPGDNTKPSPYDEDSTCTGPESGGGGDGEAPFTSISNFSWKQGRQLLRQYLQEIGYTDTIIDVRSNRVRSLLGLNNNQDLENINTTSLNGNESNKQSSDSVKNKDGQSPASAKRQIKSTSPKRPNQQPSSIAEAMIMDTEAAVMATFEFLGNTDIDMEEEEGDSEDDLYEAFRKGKLFDKKPPITLGEDVDAEAEEVLNELNLLTEREETMMDFNMDADKKRRKGYRQQQDICEEGGSSLGLGELAQLTVNNDVESYDMSTNNDFRKSWNAKYTLRSHFDGVRALVFHPTDSVLITASDDNTLKLWNLQKTVPAKKSASLDVEPLYTFRAHTGPVLCLTMDGTGTNCYSGGLDSKIFCWKLPPPNIDPYDSYDPSLLSQTLVGHTDAVWGLSMCNTRNQLLSVSADGTVKLWSPQSKVPLLNTYTSEEDKNPTSVDFIRDEPQKLVVAYEQAITIFDVETGSVVSRLEGVDLQGINRIVAHPVLPLVVTANEDHHIRFYDHRSAAIAHSMVAHLDAVTSLAIDPNGLYLLSGSHDCSIRLWNTNNKTCVQEITAHRKKFDESILDVAFHPTKPFIASAGADALAKVFV